MVRMENGISFFIEFSVIESMRPNLWEIQCTTFLVLILHHPWSICFQRNMNENWLIWKMIDSNIVYIKKIDTLQRVCILTSPIYFSDTNPSCLKVKKQHIAYIAPNKMQKFECMDCDSNTRAWFLPTLGSWKFCAAIFSIYNAIITDKKWKS